MSIDTENESPRQPNNWLPAQAGSLPWPVRPGAREADPAGGAFGTAYLARLPGVEWGGAARFRRAASQKSMGLRSSRPLGNLMGDPGPVKPKRVTDAMLKMQETIVADL